MGLTGVLIGGPFDSAEAELAYVPHAIGVYRCDENECPWKDNLHWTDWGAGRSPKAEKYVLGDRDGSRVQYVYGYRGDPDFEAPDYIAEELTRTRQRLEVLADCLTA